MCRLLVGFVPWLLACLVLGQSRTWTTTDGRKAEGELFEVVGDEIGVRISGQEYRFPLSRFMPADRSFVQQWQARPRCKLCSKTLGTRTMEAGGKTYHTACFRCLVCKKVFKGGDKFRRDQWGMLAHVDHFSFVATCGSCGRMFAKKEARREQILGDGRVTCLPCLVNAVHDEKTLGLVNERVKESLIKLGIGKPQGRVTLLLVDKRKLDVEAKRIHAGGNLKGLTLTKFRTVTKGNASNTTFEHRVMVLFGLPHVECEAVLAHEYMHVWLNERFIEGSKDTVEGFCNLASAALLNKEMSKLSSILMNNMRNNPSPVYGGGYRKMEGRLGQMGWPRLLADMRARGKKK